MKSKVHEVKIKVRFDAPLTAKQARYAVWNHISDHQLYGDGKPTAGDPDSHCTREPYGEGKISVRR
ncbi:hypothetical protein EHS39_33065 [Ensifer sp. MPMI2T]|nr:hypothetical protein EHS39_33065 [Ensifer sp. MPMI2T]